MIYFISDLHFNHDKEFVYKPRGFNSINEMNKIQIINWNKIVDKDDFVYVLGDFFLGTDLEFVEKTLNNLNGSIILIRGNHDTDTKIDIYNKSKKIVDIKWADMIKYNKRKYFLSHFPTLTGNLEGDPERCIYNLFGHIHSKDKFYEERPYMYNVAADAHNCIPISIEQIHKDIDDKIKECLEQLG